MDVKHLIFGGFDLMEWSDAAAARLRMISKEKMTQEELVKATGIPISTLQRILAGKTDPGFARLSAICSALGVDPESILTGRERGAEGIAEIPVNDIQVSAGPGRFALDEDAKIGTWPFPQAWVDDHFGGPGGLRVVRVAGDSQEPELRDGDSVLVNLNETKLRDGMHVVRLDEALMIKRIQVVGGSVRLKSANPSYDDIIVDLAADQERFRVVARAVWTIKQL